MNINKLSIIKEDDRGIMYSCDTFNLIKRHKGSISANHIHEEPETLYLIDGTIELTIEKEIKTITAPIRIHIQQSLYHKLLAVTDISLLVTIRKEEKT